MGKRAAAFRSLSLGHQKRTSSLFPPLFAHSAATILSIHTNLEQIITGKRHNKTHTLCRRCGRTTFHIQKSTCSSCGYPAARIRKCEFWILFWYRLR